MSASNKTEGLSVDIKEEIAKKLEEQQRKFYVPDELKKSALSTAIHNTNEQFKFIGGILQCLDITYTNMIPTLGVKFSANMRKWEMYINPYFFCKRLNAVQRKAVFIHEIMHLLHKHPIRMPFMSPTEHQRKLMNIAMDMTINQLIKDLPAGCHQCAPKIAKGVFEPCDNEDCCGSAIFVEHYKDDDATPWPKNMTFEYYYEKLTERFKDDPESVKKYLDSLGGGESQGQGSGDGQGSSGKGQPGSGKGQKGEPNSGGKGIGAHDWSTDVVESDLLSATEDLCKRSMMKTSLSYDDLPGFAKDMMEYIKARRAELNYKQMILMAIKKNASAIERKNTWSKRSKRWGAFAPGTTTGNLPLIHFYIDTSGSISIEEANEFLSIIDEFLRVGARECKLNMFHTSVYYTEKFKRGDRIKKDDWQSGGTCLEDVVMGAVDADPDLVIVLTDGYYGDVDVESQKKRKQRIPQFLWLISKQGTTDHPLRRLGPTVKIPG